MELLRRLYRLESVIGVSYAPGTTGVPLFTTARVRLKGHELDIVETMSFFDRESFGQYMADYSQAPVSLHIQGSGILVKSVGRQEKQAWSNDLLLEVFPSYTPERFVYTVLEGADAWWIAIAKQDKISESLDVLQALKLPVVQMHIGPAILATILPQLNRYEGPYTFGQHCITVDDTGRWTDYRFGAEYLSRFTPKVGGASIDQYQVLAYAAAFQLLMADHVEHHALPVDAAEKNYQEALHKVRFRTNALVILGATFILLLVSTILFAHYSAENERLQALHLQSSASVQDERALSATLQSQEATLQAMGWNGGFGKAWLMDRIGVTLDDHGAVSLLTLEINPAVERRRNPTDVVIVQTDRIRLTGKSPSLEGLNSWVRTLQRESWVQQVRIARFTTSPEYNDPLKVFTVDITFGQGGSDGL